MTRSMHNDPVCGMRIRDDSEFTAAYRGREYHFCSARCRDRFAAEPTTYVGAEHEREHQHEHERAAAPLPRFAFAAVVCVFAAISSALTRTDPPLLVRSDPGRPLGSSS